MTDFLLKMSAAVLRQQLSCLPVTYIQLATGGMENASDAKLARLLRLVRLTKVLKLARIANLLQRNAEGLRDIDGLDVIKAGVMTVIFAHLTACAWHYIGIGKHFKVSEPDEMPQYLLSDEYMDSGMAYTWIEAYDSSLLNGTLGNKYGTSLYFATTTLSTVGYGDILPTNENERLFTAFFQVCIKNEELCIKITQNRGIVYQKRGIMY